jgi:hypothetical protein
MQTKTKRQGDKETKRQRDKETKRQRDKETKRQRDKIEWCVDVEFGEIYNGEQMVTQVIVAPYVQGW